MNGITCGAFDLFHAGHVLFLKDCRDNCDTLVVMLQEDPSVDREWKNSPIQSLTERKIQLQGCKYVNDILAYQTEEELYNWLEWINWDIRFLGSDYENKSSEEITGFDLGPIQYFSRDHGWSSTELRKRISS